MISGIDAKQIHKKWNDTMKSIHDKIQAVISIPVFSRRMNKIGAWLEWKKALTDGYLTQNDAGLHLVVNAKHLQAWQAINNMVSVISHCCVVERVPSVSTCIKNYMNEFFSMIPKHDTGLAMGHLEMFRQSFVPAVLVMLYISPVETRKDAKKPSVIKKIFPVIRELTDRLSNDLILSTELLMSPGLLFGDVCDFQAILLPLYTVVKQAGDSDPILKMDFEEASHFLLIVFHQLLRKMNECLTKMPDCLTSDGKWGIENAWFRWSHHLAILKELNSISRLYEDLEKEFWMSLWFKEYSPIYMLLIKYAKPTDDYRWLLEHSNEYSYEFRRHLARQIIPKVNEDFGSALKVVINRFCNTLTLFTHVEREGHQVLPNYLFSPSKAEEFAAGLKIFNALDLMEKWFPSICQAIFNPQNSLFVACPNDPTRFYPNPACKLDPVHLECFRLSGSLIALSLMHKVKVDIVFDRVFFLQLAGKNISLGDIRDADPCLYSSCYKLLGMDSKFADPDALKVRFIEVLESSRVVELCPGGKNIMVNSKNRKEYIDLLIQRRFVTSIAKQISYFAQGFGDVFGNSSLQKFFFCCLELEDLDQMLRGSGSTVSLFDSKGNAVCHGYDSDFLTFCLPKIRRQRHIIRHWEKGQLLGHGAFGSVYEGYASGGFFFAVKEVQLLAQASIQAKQCVYQLQQEIALLSQFNHENIVQYYGTARDESKLYIFLELVSNGSLAELYIKYHLSDSQVSAYTRQILHGLKYLHERKVIHRDIKCANILVNVRGTVKLADFGLAKVTEFSYLIKSCKGTPCWNAPEVVNPKRGGYGLPADIWSLGCTVLEMLTGKRPYSHLEPEQVLYRIGKGELPPVPDSLSNDSRDFILQCLQLTPSDRPTAAQLLDHAFIKSSFLTNAGLAPPHNPG